MNRKTLFIILVILVITALVAGGVAVWTHNRAGKKNSEPLEIETNLPSESPEITETTETTVSVTEEPVSQELPPQETPDILYGDLEPEERPAYDPEPAIRSVTIQ